MSKVKLFDGLPDGVAVRIQIDIYNSGAMSVMYPIHDKKWTISALNNAIDAVKSHGQPQKELLVPAKDVLIAA